MRDDDLNAASGIINGLALAAVFWFLIFVIVKSCAGA
jgi:hypothetical protein